MRKYLFPLLLLTLAAVAGFISPSAASDALGYTDTPMLPSGKWHVHDPARPAPTVVTPGATFSDGAAAPSDAIVLFDGHDLSQWAGDKGAPQWKIHPECAEIRRKSGHRASTGQPKLEPGYIEVAPHTGYIHTRQEFGDFQLHLEWAEPAQVRGKSQERGNSGVFLQGVYELQVLDSYDSPTYADGQCGALYGQTPPLVNACKKPGAWQTYDIIFEAARFGSDHQLMRPASVTVLQNGVLLHHNQAYLGPTGHKILASYKNDTPTRGPIALQDHGNPVRYRNIWIRNIADEEKP